MADVTGYRVTAWEESLLRRIWTADQSTLRVVDGKTNKATAKALVDEPGRQCILRRSGGAYAGPSCFNPHGLAWSDAHGGRLFVTDPDNGAIVLFSASGEHVRTIRNPAAFTTPRGLALVSCTRLASSEAVSQSLLVVAERDRVLMLSLNGHRLLHVLRVPGAINMLGIGLDVHRRTLYVADPGAKAVFVVAYGAKDIEATGSTASQPAAMRATSTLPAAAPLERDVVEL